MPGRSFATDYALEVSLGNETGTSNVEKFGRNGGIATNTTEEIWTVSTDRTTLSVAATLEAISSDGNDTAAGSGAQIITVEGVDGSWNAVSEDITMAGASASTATSASFFRVNRAFVKQTGTYRGNNEGTITIRVSSAGSTQAQIELGKGQTEQSHYTVPTGMTLHMKCYWLSNDASSTRNLDSEIYQFTGVDDVATSFVGAKRKLHGVTGLGGGIPYQHKFENIKKVSGPADVVIFATAPAGGSVSVEAGFCGYLTTD